MSESQRSWWTKGYHGQPMVSPWSARPAAFQVHVEGGGLISESQVGVVGGSVSARGPSSAWVPWVFWIPGRRSLRCAWVGYVLKTTAAEPLLGSHLDHLGYLGRQRLRMKERRGCDGDNPSPHWILRVKFWDGAWSSTVLRAKSSMTFSEYRERLNPLVNHDYLILSAFQWP